jgi:hypothetical protein
VCFSLNLPNDQLADMAVVGMLPAIREKLFAMEFDNLGQLSHRLSLMSNQAYGFKKDSRFAKHNDIADIYNQFLERADQGKEFDDEEEIAAAEMVWGKEPLTVLVSKKFDFYLQTARGARRPFQFLSNIKSEPEMDQAS